MASRVLITGGNGRLGKEFLKVYPNALTPSHTELDVADADKTMAYITEHKPGIVIHLAAMTAVQGCEDHKEEAWKINVGGTANVVKACKSYHRSSGGFRFPYLVHMSTPCVFSGREGNYTEDSLPYPVNFYGLTKALAEQIVANSTIENKLIVRGNFVPREPWPYPKAFEDRFGSYLFANQVAAGIKEVVREKMTGIVHIAGTRKLSMFELAKMTTPNIQPMTLKDYHGTHLTVDMTLDSKRWKKYDIA